MENNTISGHAGDLCTLPRIDMFVADCTTTDDAGATSAEFTCPCCTRCCPSALCNDAWLTNVAGSLLDDYYQRSFDYSPVGI